MSESTNNKNEIIKEVLSWVKEIVIVLLVVYFITTFVVQNTMVIGESMEPTLQDGNAILVNKFIYRFADPARFDIIVFPYRGNPSKNYIKRIIGLPGDAVNIKNNTVYINGQALEEDYINEPMQHRGNVDFPITIPEGQYFVMGDNRNNSSDSRYQDVGLIPKADIMGKASLRIWPVNELGFLH